MNVQAAQAVKGHEASAVEKLAGKLEVADGKIFADIGTGSRGGKRNIGTHCWAAEVGFTKDASGICGDAG